MAKVKIDLKGVNKILREADIKIRPPASKEIAETVIEIMKERISKGNSPIEGKGRFPAYKDISKYPKSVLKDYPAKRNRPVNLYLSGKFLSMLKFRLTPARKEIIIGFFDSYGKKLEQGHREGANGQRERPIIPSNGERFARAIQLSILKIYEKAVKNYLKRVL